MTAMELKCLKMELVEELLSIDDKDTLNRVKNYLKKLNNKIRTKAEEEETEYISKEERKQQERSNRPSQYPVRRILKAKHPVSERIQQRTKPPDRLQSSRSDAHFSLFFFAHIRRTTFDGISIRTISDGVTFHCDPE